jgi:hypothetical protein
MDITEPLIVTSWTAAKKCEQVCRTNRIPYRKNGVAAMGPYVTVFTRFAAPAPGVVFREKVKVIGKG